MGSTHWHDPAGGEGRHRDLRNDSGGVLVVGHHVVRERQFPPRQKGASGRVRLRSGLPLRPDRGVLANRLGRGKRSKFRERGRRTSPGQDRRLPGTARCPRLWGISDPTGCTSYPRRGCALIGGGPRGRYRLGRRPVVLQCRLLRLSVARVLSCLCGAGSTVYDVG
jgi:hypothetical protein